MTDTNTMTPGARDDAAAVRRGETLRTTVTEHARAVHAAVPGSRIWTCDEHGTSYICVALDTYQRGIVP